MVTLKLEVRKANLHRIIQIVYLQYFNYMYFKLYIYSFTLFDILSAYIIIMSYLHFAHKKQSFIPKMLNIKCTLNQSLFNTSTKYSMFIYSYSYAAMY